MSEPDTIRLNKILAERGAASRRGADELISQGAVTVNDKTVTELGTRVLPTDTIAVHGNVLPPVKTVVYLLNKPRGVISSREQQGDTPIVTGLVPSDPPVYPVGRLDKESEGLILLTNDGDLTHTLTHPSFEHTKEYLVHTTLPAAATVGDICKRLMAGVTLEDGPARADFAELIIRSHHAELLIILHEGRNHIVRRMCASVGLNVHRLIRTKIGTLELGNLPVGTCRRLTPAEITQLTA